MGVLKVGDKVKIKSLEWYNSAQKDTYSGGVKLKGNVFVTDMLPHLGKDAIITEIVSNGYFPNYLLDIDQGTWYWTDEMFEGYEEKCFEVYQFGNLFVKVDSINKIVFPEFFDTYQEAAEYGN